MFFEDLQLLLVFLRIFNLKKINARSTHIHVLECMNLHDCNISDHRCLELGTSIFWLVVYPASPIINL